MNEEHTQEPAPQPQNGEVHIVEEVNIYPFLRSLFLGLFLILSIIAILFLLYVNGKSIYESGI
jgi:hypothetical protein